MRRLTKQARWQPQKRKHHGNITGFAGPASSAPLCLGMGSAAKKQRIGVRGSINGLLAVVMTVADVIGDNDGEEEILAEIMVCSD